MVPWLIIPCALVVAADEQPPKSAPWQLQCPVVEAAAAHQPTAMLRQLWRPLVTVAVAPMVPRLMTPCVLVVAADEQPPKSAHWQLQCPVLKAVAALQPAAMLRQLWRPHVTAAVAPMVIWLMYYVH